MKDFLKQQKKKQQTPEKRVHKNAPAKLQKPLRGNSVHKKAHKEQSYTQKVQSFINLSIKWIRQVNLKQLRSGIAFARFFSDKKPRIIRKGVAVQKTKDYSYNFETDLQLALVPLILFAVLAIVMLINNHYLAIIAENKLPSVSVFNAIEPFPLVDNVIPPDISAKAAIVLDADSQVIVMSKNPQIRFSMASTTKIMTALTALDYFKLNDILTVKSAGVEGSGLGLIPGEQFTFSNLLYAMLLPSANDAAVAIADNYKDGGRAAFVTKMNEKAAFLHLPNTHFADPVGLDDDENFTTVVDLARLGSYAMKNSVFAGFVGTKTKTIYDTTYTRMYPLENSNHLLGTKGVNGIKTGTTEGAGEVLVTSALVKGHHFIIVVMNSDDRFADTTTLLDFVNQRVQYILPSIPPSHF